MNGLRSTIGIYSFHELKKLWPFLNMPIRPGIICSGMKLILLTKTLTGTLVELRRLSTWGFILTTSTGTVELKFLKCGCLQLDNMRDNLFQPQRTAEGSVSSSHNANNALDRNPPTMSEVCDTPITNNHTIAWWRPALCGWNVAINIKVAIVRQMIKPNPLYTGVLYNEWYYSLRYMYAWYMYNVGLFIVSHFVFDWGLLNFILLHVVFIKWQCWFSELISPPQ